MSIKFFGQFLIEQGEVDAGHVRAALDLLGQTNRSLGAVAIDEGFRSSSQWKGISLLAGITAQRAGGGDAEVSRLLQERRRVSTQRDDRLVALSRALGEEAPAEQIEQLQKSVESSDLDDERKQRAADLFRGALESIQKADEFANQAGGFQAAVESMTTMTA